MNLYTSTVLWGDTIAKNDQAAREADERTIGFSCGPTNMEAQIASSTVIFNKYVPAIKCGASHPADEIPTSLAELEKAGYRDIIAGVQAQLDAYVAS